MIADIQCWTWVFIQNTIHGPTRSTGAWCVCVDYGRRKRVGMGETEVFNEFHTHWNDQQDTTSTSTRFRLSSTCRNGNCIERRCQMVYTIYREIVDRSKSPPHSEIFVGKFEQWNSEHCMFGITTSSKCIFGIVHPREVALSFSRQIPNSIQSYSMPNDSQCRFSLSICNAIRARDKILFK